MKTDRIFASVCIIMVTASLSLNAQVRDIAELQQMFDSKNFVFRARTAFPQGGGSRELTSDYDLTVTGDKVVSFLPYFGRAYAASPGEEGGIKFTSTDFEYKARQYKKGWTITIVPKDANAVQKLFLDISGSGYATLQVTSSRRSLISFYGIIEKVK